MNLSFKALMRRSDVHALLIVAIGLLCYSNTFDAPFQWDDVPYIQNNPTIKGLGDFWNPSNEVGLKEYSRALRTRSMGYLTFLINYKISGFDVTGYHVINISVHLINALLTYLLILLTLNTPALSKSRLRDHAKSIGLISALFFVCHPVQIEAVTYVFQRHASLAAMFYLLSLALYIVWRLESIRVIERARIHGKMFRNKMAPIFYLASLLSAVLAMNTKENAFTLPFSILLYEFIFMDRKRLFKRVSSLIPFALTLFIIPLSMTGLDRSMGEIIGSIGLSSKGYALIERADYLFTQMRVIVTYLRLLVFPVGQNIAYEHSIYNSFLAPPVLLSFLFLLFIFSIGIYCLRRSRATDNAFRITAFGIFFFFLTLSVESSVIPIPMVINEYRLYLPSIGFFMAIVPSVYFLSLNLKTARKALIVFLMLLIFINAGATFARNTIWETRTGLWEDTVKKSPHSAVAHFNLAVAYNEKGMNQRAIDHYRTVVRLDPLYVEAYYGLGVLYHSSGLTGNAIENYLAALKLNPNFAEANNNMGAIYNEIGMYKEAIRHFKEALRSSPDYPEAHFNIAVSYGLLNMPDHAISHLKKTIELEPDHIKAHINMGIALAANGIFDIAEKHFITALKLDPNNPKPQKLLNMLYESEFEEPSFQWPEQEIKGK